MYKKMIFLFAFGIFFLSPLSLAHAQFDPNVVCFMGGDSKCLIPCDGVTKECTFDSFVQLVQNLINYLILLSIPLCAIAFAWAGFLIVTSGGSEERVTQGKAIFGKVLWGFLFVLGAWLIVYTITTGLLLNSSDYTLLK